MKLLVKSWRANWRRNHFVAQFPTRSSPDESAVVVAPHPDDETFGADGVIAPKREAGLPVSAIESKGVASVADRGVANIRVQRGRVATNLAANVAAFMCNLLIGIWYTPYLIACLGTEAYGMIPLATQMVSYVGVVSVAVSSAAVRFMTIALEQEDTDEANEYFNTSLIASGFVTVFLCAAFLLIALNAEWIISIPAGQTREVQSLLVCVGFVLVLGSLQAPFSVSTYAVNRFDLAKIPELGQRFITIATVITLFAVAAPRIWHVGLGMLLGAGVSAAGVVGLCRILTPRLRISPSRFTFDALKELGAMSGWVAINGVGALLFLAIDLVVVNRLLGPLAGGYYAAVLQWSVMLRAFANVTAAVFGPTIVQLHARSEIATIVKYSQRAAKCVGLIIALPVGMIAGFATPLLANWLGAEFTHLAPLLQLLVFPLSINLAVLPLFNIFTATNRVRLPALLTLVFGLGNVALAVLLGGHPAWGVYGVAAASAISLTMKNLVFTPIYCAAVLGLRWTTFPRSVFSTLAAATITCAASAALSSVVPLDGWFPLITAGMGVSASYVILVYRLALNADERELLLKAIPGTSGGK